MATKSILKDVLFRDKSLCRGYATALEHAKGKKSKEGRISRTCQTIQKDKITDFFGDK